MRYPRLGSCVEAIAVVLTATPSSTAVAAMVGSGNEGSTPWNHNCDVNAVEGAPDALVGPSKTGPYASTAKPSPSATPTGAAQPRPPVK